MKLKQVAVPSGVYHFFKEQGSTRVQRFVSKDGLSILYSVDKTQHGDLLHLSVSKPDRYPSWDEIVEVKEALMGDIDTMMVIPKKEDYVNLHQYCFHVWQTPVAWDIR